MNNDPGHDTAEEILQVKQDDHHGDLADTQSEREIPMPKPIWTFCECCMTQRDHILVDKAWICSSCGTKNKNLPIFIYTPFVKPSEPSLEEKSEEE